MCLLGANVLKLVVYREWLLKTRDWSRNLFIKLEEKDYGEVSFGDNRKGKIIGKGTIGINQKIHYVPFVKGLKFNMISVIQLYDKRMDVNFKRRELNVLRDEKVVLKAKTIRMLHFGNW